MAITIKILYFLEGMVTVPKTYYHYRKVSNSIVATDSVKHKKDWQWARKEMIDFAIKNNINLNINKSFIRKVYFKLLGITILKIYYYKESTRFRLFGFIPFLTKVEK